MSSYFASNFLARFFYVKFQKPLNIRQTLVKFPGVSNFQELRMSCELGHSRSWTAARLSNFTRLETAQGRGRPQILNNFQKLRAAKLEKFRKFIYNKRGNININISTIKLDPSQIFRPHKNAAHRPIPGTRRGRTRKAGFLQPLGKG